MRAAFDTNASHLFFACSLDLSCIFLSTYVCCALCCVFVFLFKINGPPQGPAGGERAEPLSRSPPFSPFNFVHLTYCSFRVCREGLGELLEAKDDGVGLHTSRQTDHPRVRRGPHDNARVGKLRPDRQEYFLAGFAAHFLRTYVRVASA